MGGKREAGRVVARRTVCAPVRSGEVAVTAARSRNYAGQAVPIVGFAHPIFHWRRRSSRFAARRADRASSFEVFHGASK